MPKAGKLLRQTEGTKARNNIEGWVQVTLPLGEETTGSSFGDIAKNLLP